MTVTLQALGTIIAALLGGGLVNLLRVRARNQLDDSNSAVALANAYGKLIDQLEKRTEHLEAHIGRLESRIVLLEDENRALRSRVSTV